MLNIPSKFEIGRWAAVLIMSSLLVLGGLTGTAVAAKTGLISGVANAAGPVFHAAASKPMVNAESLAAGFRPIVQQTLPAVVNISSARVVRTSGGEAPFFMEPFFRDFFGDRFQRDMPRERRQRGEGSGVIVSADGYILTNEHVVRDASEISVMLADKREFKAKMIGSDPKTDIAVLKVEEKGLPFLKLGDSSSLQVGDLVLAMGNPFGIGQTVTMGIVSAVARHGVMDADNYEDFIQTDAAINPGNSGGALVNMSGELVGINSAILSRTGGNVGIGFAVPSNLARHVMEQIVKDGRVIRGWLGVVIQPVDSAVAKAFGFGEPKGALVGDVSKAGPAAGAGIQKGDIIVEFNGQPVADVSDLRLKVAMTAPNSKVNVKVFRDGKQVTVPVTLGELPEEQQRAAVSGGEHELMDGVQLQDLSPQLARQLGLPADSYGAVISNVRPGSAAEEAGLRRGDVVQEVNRKRITNAAGFRQEIRAAGNQPVVLLVNRGGNTLFVVVEPR